MKGNYNAFRLLGIMVNAKGGCYMVDKSWCRALRKWGLVVCLAMPLVLSAGHVFAGDDEASDDSQASQQEATLGAKRAKSPIILIKERIEAKIPKLAFTEGKTMIKEVTVTGSTILAPDAINKLKAEYENRELSPRSMQGAADRVTRAYVREGYITSFAVVNADKIATGVLEIQVKEGKTGKLIIEGNKYFSSEVFRKRITLKEGDLFNFKELNQDVFKINKAQDHKANISIDPNMETGFTDITLSVKDKSPMHVMLQDDNYASEYIGYRRHKVFLIDNNLTGHDDTLQFKAQLTEADAHKLFDFDYNLPLNNEWKLELYLMPFKKENYKSDNNASDNFEKHAWKWYFWFHDYLIDKPDCEFISSYGFFFKQISWYTYHTRQAQDHFRSLEWQLDLNKPDKYGRWVASNMVEWGIPELFGGADRKDDKCSIASAGGAYKRDFFTLARRQHLGNDIDFLAKAHYQISSMTLTGVNVFDVGGLMGVIDDRGYPRAQFAGDSGRSLTAGFSIPVFGMSKTAVVPGSKTKWYDDIRLFNFLDYAVGVLKSPKLGDDKVQTLTSAGFGMTFNVPDWQLQTRLDIGWPVTKRKPADGDSPHIYYGVTKMF